MSTESTMKCDGCGETIEGYHHISLREEGVSGSGASEVYFIEASSNPFMPLDFCSPRCLKQWLAKHPS